MRRLVWIAESGMLGCSECDWVFRPRGSPKGKSPEEMMRDFESQRDEAFASHVCTERPKEKET
jgi:hypothetical protein